MSPVERARGILLSLTGAHLDSYKDNLLLRRLRSRARLRGLSDAERYLDWLEGGTPEALPDARELVASLRVRVSGFFRDPQVFAALENVVFPRLLEGREDPVRVWSAACARGQEAYSLAISLGRFARRQGRDPGLWVLGTDLDATAVAAAQRAVYTDRELETVPPDVVEEAFERAPAGGWRVRSEVRERVRFQQADVFDLSAHPAGVDLVACRNLLIYLNRSAQEELILALRHALRPGGFLLLGSSETVLGRPWSRFVHTSPVHRIYRRPI